MQDRRRGFRNRLYGLVTFSMRQSSFACIVRNHPRFGAGPSPTAR